MQISEDEAGQLFVETPLLDVSSVSLLVAFGRQYLPDPEETILLGNIISKGYSCSPALVHFFYDFESEDQAGFQVQLDQFQPDLTLIFDPETQDLRQTRSEEYELIYLPDLSKIEENIGIKKDLWSRLKQLRHP